MGIETTGIDLNAALTIVVIVAAVLLWVVVWTVYEAAKEAREYYRRANAAHRHDGDPSMP